MSRRLTPESICPPFARYAHAVEVEAGARLLFVSGQLGVRPDGTVADGAEAQALQCFANISAILAAAGMSARDLVRFNAYVTDRTHLPDYMRARDAFIAGIAEPPASTLMIVAGFARPELLVEVEAVAARREERP